MQADPVSRIARMEALDASSKVRPHCLASILGVLGNYNSQKTPKVLILARSSKISLAMQPGRFET